MELLLRFSIAASMASRSPMDKRQAEVDLGWFVSEVEPRIRIATQQSGDQTITYHELSLCQLPKEEGDRLSFCHMTATRSNTMGGTGARKV